MLESVLSRGSRSLGLAVPVVGLVVLAVLAVLALRADAATSPDARLWISAGDLATGLAFPIAARLARGPLVERLLVAAVGPAWFAGAFLAVARPLHLALLAVALLAFPAGRIHGATRWLLTAGAAFVALRPVEQLLTAALFAGVTVVSVRRPQTRATANLFPAVAGAAVSAGLAALWWDGHRDFGSPHLTVRFVGYASVLVFAAAVFVWATRALAAADERLADEVLAGSPSADLDGLEGVLRHVLGDQSLRIRVGVKAADTDRKVNQLVVESSDGPAAVVMHKCPILDEPSAAEAVSSAVRLVLTNARLREEQERRLVELEAARVRLVAATDMERAHMVAALRVDVGRPLRAATMGMVQERPGVTDADAIRTLDVAIGEVRAAEREIARLVAGVPPETMGGGQLSGALIALAERIPVSTTVTVEESAAANADTETTFFFVCSEALTNAVKHAGATRIECTVRRDGNEIVLTVTDDGCGGADASGSGLLGLVDRLASRGGRLRVDSPPGAGTSLVATLPD